MKKYRIFLNSHDHLQAQWFYVEADCDGVARDKAIGIIDNGFWEIMHIEEATK